MAIVLPPLGHLLTCKYKSPHCPMHLSPYWGRWGMTIIGALHKWKYKPKSVLSRENESRFSHISNTRSIITVSTLWTIFFCTRPWRNFSCTIHTNIMLPSPSPLVLPRAHVLQSGNHVHVPGWCEGKSRQERHLVDNSLLNPNPTLSKNLTRCRSFHLTQVA